MQTSLPPLSPNHGQPSPAPLAQTFSDALRFWEPRRILYNLILAAVVLIWIFASWPHFRPAFTLTSLLTLAVLAFLANLCYCAAYFVDIPLQRSALRELWTRGRRGLWVLGMLLAVLFENYWIVDEIYPFVR